MILFLELFFTSLFFNSLRFLYLSNGKSSSVRTIHLEMSIAMALDALLSF